MTASRAYALITFICLSACVPRQGNQIDSMPAIERMNILEAKTDQELCNDFTNPYSEISTKAQVKEILKTRNVQECYGQYNTYAYVTEPKPPAPVKTESRELTEKEKSAITVEVKNNLKDPDSAKFKWEKFIYSGDPTFGSYCGHVNAKNGFGGYTGDQMFSVLLLSKNGVIRVADTIIGDNAINLCADYW
ncbi:MAG: hypothetical protein KJ017_09900 [Alphaproteobacteria bacterium]|nr:hypothetical protein [Alphaproteobacteria bacterium]